MKYLLKIFFIFSGLVVALVYSRSISLPSFSQSSPNGKNKLIFFIDGKGSPNIIYTVDKDTLFKSNKIEYQFFNSRPLKDNFEIVDVVKKSSNGHLKIANNSLSNVIEITLKEKYRNGRYLKLNFKIFDNGLAFQYEVKAQKDVKNIGVNNENIVLEFFKSKSIGSFETKQPNILLQKSDSNFVLIKELHLPNYAPSLFEYKDFNNNCIIKSSLYNYNNNNINYINKSLSPWKLIFFSKNVSNLFKGEEIKNFSSDREDHNLNIIALEKDFDDIFSKVALVEKYKMNFLLPPNSAVSSSYYGLGDLTKNINTKLIYTITLQNPRIDSLETILSLYNQLGSSFIKLNIVNKPEWLKGYFDIESVNFIYKADTMATKYKIRILSDAYLDNFSLKNIISTQSLISKYLPLSNLDNKEDKNLFIRSLLPLNGVNVFSHNSVIDSVSSEILKQLPYEWDDNRIIRFEPNKYIIVLHLHKDKCLLAGYNFTNETISLNLKYDFLTSGVNYIEHSYFDYTDKIMVMKDDIQSIILLPNDGFVISITPENKIIATSE